MKEIILSQGKVALVNDEDFDYLNQFKWYSHKNWYTYYAIRYIRIDGKKTTIRMHRDILVCTKGKCIDHIDRDGLNNQKSNLRICNYSQNAMNSKMHITNTSGYRGVTWDKKSKKWRSHIKLNGKTIYLGLYLNPEEASLAYQKASKELFGEYYNPNP